MSCNSKTAGERLARVVTKFQERNSIAPMATNPPSFMNVGRRKFRKNSPLVQHAPLCCFMWYYRFPLPTGSGMLSAAPPIPPQPCSSGRQTGSGCSFWILSGCQVSYYTRIPGLSLSCRKMGPESPHLCHPSSQRQDNPGDEAWAERPMPRWDTLMFHCLTDLLAQPSFLEIYTHTLP